MRQSRVRVLALALALLGGSCSKSAGPPGAPHPRPSTTPLVARVGEVELREEDVQRAMSRDPGAAAARFAEPSARQELVDGLVRFQLLAQAADREGFTRDPDAIHALQQIAVTKLVNAKLGEVASPESISRADIEQDYRARQARDYTLPPAARVRHIRVRELKVAVRVASLAKALSPSDADGFSKLVARFSEDAATRSAEGELGYVDATSTLPAALVNAALALRAPGDVAGPIETPLGYEIVRLVDRRAAAVSPLSSVAESIRQRLYRERRAKALDQYIDQLRRETPIELAAAPAR